MICPKCKKGELQEDIFDDQIYCPECEEVYQIIQLK